MPAAPGRFSTTNCCFKRLLNCSPRMRMPTSATPPAPYGTISVTGRLGYSRGVCAAAGNVMAAAANSTAATATILRPALMSFASPSQSLSANLLFGGDPSIDADDVSDATCRIGLQVFAAEYPDALSAAGSCPVGGFPNQLM